jgi:hypothetical protein
MAHHYGEVVLIRRHAESGAAASRTGAPAAFVWRGVWYQVDETLATWRLRDRWWATPSTDTADATDVGGWGAPHADALPPTDRVYYRVRCVDPEGEQIFDLYYDAATGQWVLDRAHD